MDRVHVLVIAGVLVSVLGGCEPDNHVTQLFSASTPSSFDRRLIAFMIGEASVDAGVVPVRMYAASGAVQARGATVFSEEDFYAHQVTAWKVKGDSFVETGYLPFDSIARYPASIDYALDGMADSMVAVVVSLGRDSLQRVYRWLFDPRKEPYVVAQAETLVSFRR